jgi:hypothetical protein
MKLDISKINYLWLGLGILGCALVLAYIWFGRTQNPLNHRERDFLEWKIHKGRIQASFDEFLRSGEAPRDYLSKGEESIVIILLGLLVLFFELKDWGVIA